MSFDDQGHVSMTPRELYDRAGTDPDRLLNAYLMGGGTPVAFARYEQYCCFLEAVSEHTGVHPKNLYIRGSCHLGFSIAPKADKLWIAVGHKSDLDLVIVDAPYFHRCEEDLRRWEARNPVVSPRDKGASIAARRAEDRRFNCIRDRTLPNVVCVHHRKMMRKVAEKAHCGHFRDVSAFIYPDWHSAQERYEFDLRELRKGVEAGWLAPPPNQPIQR